MTPSNHHDAKALAQTPGWALAEETGRSRESGNASEAIALTFNYFKPAKNSLVQELYRRPILGEQPNA